MFKTINCPVCAANNYKVILKTEETADFYNLNKDIIFSIVRCKRCSMVYVNPLLDDVTRDRIYSSGMLPFEQSFENKRQMEYLRIIKRIKKINQQAGF